MIHLESVCHLQRRLVGMRERYFRYLRPDSHHNVKIGCRIRGEYHFTSLLREMKSSSAKGPNILTRAKVPPPWEWGKVKNGPSSSARRFSVPVNLIFASTRSTRKVGVPNTRL